MQRKRFEFFLVALRRTKLKMAALKHCSKSTCHKYRYLWRSKYFSPFWMGDHVHVWLHTVYFWRVYRRVQALDFLRPLWSLVVDGLFVLEASRTSSWLLMVTRLPFLPSLSFLGLFPGLPSSALLTCKN